MKATFATLIVAMAQANVHWSQLRTYSFDQFVQDYKLNLQ